MNHINIITNLENESALCNSKGAFLETTPPDTDGLVEEKLPLTPPPPSEESGTTFTFAHIQQNRGTGAGGANTNLHGKKFEEKTNNEPRLLENGFEKHYFSKKTKKMHDYLSKKYDDRTEVFVLQSGLKKYMRNTYNIELFRCPDEAYIIQYNTGKKRIIILEKKEQNVEGSVETKLWSGPSLKREYELALGEDFNVCYGFCVSEFLKKKLTSDDRKYTILRQILTESDISVLYGDDDDYFKTFDDWRSTNSL